MITIDNIYARLKKLNKLNDNEKMIVQYLIDHLDEIPDLSSNELARRTYTSSTAIIRFIKKLNYRSYTDFRLHIVSDLKNMKQPDLTIFSNEDLLTLVNKISDIEISIIQKTKEMLHMSQLKDIIVLLAQYQYIDIIANDTNATIAEYASHLLWSVGKFVHVYHYSNQQLLVGLNIPKDHIVIIISKYGRNTTLLKTALSLRSRGITTIAMISQADRALGKKCTYQIYGLVEESSEKLRDTVFFISLKYILDIIYVILFSQNYENTLQLETLYNNIFEKKL